MTVLAYVQTEQHLVAVVHIASRDSGAFPVAISGVDSRHPRYEETNPT